MAATPKTGQARFLGLSSGKTLVYNIYNPDVSGSPITWNPNGAAVSGSDDNIICPEDMQLVDVSVVTGIVDTTSLVLYVNGAIKSGYLILWSNVVNSNPPPRLFPTFSVSKGAKLQLKCA